MDMVKQLTDIVDISSYLPELKSIWQESTGESEITVAILDGPVDLSHPCFEGADLTLLETLTSIDANNAPSSQHGTNVASIIFGQHGSSVRGISPGCRGLIVPVFSDSSDDSLAPCSQIDLAHAITQSVEQGAQVINISGGEIDSSGEPHPLLAGAIRLCAENNVLVVAAAGNDGCQCLHIPAAVPSTLAVGAMDAQGLPLKFSNWGDAYRANGILAPGERIMVAVSGGGVATKSGTSFATSIVSGIIALLLSIQMKRGNRPDPYAVREAILRSAHSCSPSADSDCRRYLAGSLNVAGAYNFVTKIDHELGKETHQMYYQRYSPGALKTLENAASIAELIVTETTNQKEEEKKMVEAIDQTCSCITKQEEEEKMEEEEEMVGPTENTCGCSRAEAALSQMPAMAVRAAESLESHPTIEKASVVMPKQVQPSQAPDSAQLVYALGMLGFDFGTEARKDAFIQSMEGDLPNPNDPMQLLAHLEKNPEYSASLIWTLEIEATAVYAIRPAGTFSPRAYERLREFLKGQRTEGVERVSIPGILAGQVRLLSGQVVPVIIPEVRGMYSWSTATLVHAVTGPEPPKGADANALKQFSEKQEGVRNFLKRIYYEVMNLGRASQERAMNFAATNAFMAAAVFEQAVGKDLMLDSIETERSPVCRPDSDCWDVKLTFFNPKERLTVARTVFRFTVDVSDVVPVTIGEVRSWSVY
ncbi:Halolysin [uncultured archaeon]|nr:Halolysin [uncultured archaeon]